MWIGNSELNSARICTWSAPICTQHGLLRYPPPIRRPIEKRLCFGNPPGETPTHIHGYDVATERASTSRAASWIHAAPRYARKMRAPRVHASDKIPLHALSQPPLLPAIVIDWGMHRPLPTPSPEGVHFASWIYVLRRWCPHPVTAQSFCALLYCEWEFRTLPAIPWGGSALPQLSIDSHTCNS